MPLLPPLIGLLALAAGAIGVGAAIKSKIDRDEAEDINKDAKDVYDDAESSLKRCVENVQAKLGELGKQKMTLYEETLTPFVETFSRIKNVDFDGLDIPDELLADIEADILEMKKIGVQVSEAIGGGASALGAGALTGWAAFGSVGWLGTASTGTAIGSLSGAAATNATLAWWGGGSLATGGLGMVGGTVMLGGVVLGPALLVGGLMFASKAAEAKENARSNLEKAKAAAELMQTDESRVLDIGRMADQTRSVLFKLCDYFEVDVVKLKYVVQRSNDYRTYDDEDKAVVARAATVAITLKNIAETPLLEEDGSVTDAIGDTVRNAKKFLKTLNAM